MGIDVGLTSRSIMKLLLCLLSVMVFLGGFQVKCCLPNERVGLLQIMSHFSSLSDTEYVSNPPFASWDGKSDCCEWERVVCNTSTRQVTQLFLNKTVLPHEAWPLDMIVFQPFQELRILDLSNNRIGSLVLEGLGTLNNLQELDLRSNEIAYIPEFLWNLSSLRVLDLSRCQLTGKLAAPLCGLKKIRELYFSDNQLDGNLPLCLWNLTSLHVIDLSGNHFSGNLPSRINLPSLEWLSIEGNNFHGKFSFGSIVNHSSLMVLVLSNNRLQVEMNESKMQLQILGLASCNLEIHTKTLEKFLIFQSALQYIDLSGNRLSGSFPTWLLMNNSDLKLLNLASNSLSGSLQLLQHSNLSLVSLDISNNQFSGKIPHNIGMMLSDLQLLQMSNNSFNGRIPSSLGNMAQLQVVDLSNNNLVGEVPNMLFSYCSRLGFLVLSNNSLYGEIIPTNMNLPSLYVLSLDNNHFVGTFEESLKKSTVLEYFDISNNKVEGEVPEWIGSLSELSFMSLAANRFHGSIPTQIFCIEYLQHLDLSGNRFEGEIPSSSCPSSLLSLTLYGNNLTGGIPKGLTASYNLKVLNLASNQLSGGVPTWINVFSNMTILVLGDNQLQGELPAELCQLQRLNVLDVSNNRISGAIPSCFQSLSFGGFKGDYVGEAENSVLLKPSSILFKLKSHYIFRDDVERGDFKFEIVGIHWKGLFRSFKGVLLSFVSVFDLSCNQFTGKIPPELGEMKDLYSMNLSHNQLCGSIPESFSKLKIIEILDLSYNKLSGKIPLQLQQLTFLEVFNVSYNNLSGEVPESYQFDTFNASSYIGNPHLCGSLMHNNNKCRVFYIIPASSPLVKLEDEEDNAFDLQAFFWSFGVSFIAALFTFFLVFYIKTDWRTAWFAFIDLHLLWWIY